jgi:hypothetical protein
MPQNPRKSLENRLLQTISQLGSGNLPVRDLPDWDPVAAKRNLDATTSRADSLITEMERKVQEGPVMRLTTPREDLESIGRMIDPIGAYTQALPAMASQIANVVAGRHSEAERLTPQQIRAQAEAAYGKGIEARIKRNQNGRKFR